MSGFIIFGRFSRAIKALAEPEVATASLRAISDLLIGITSGPRRRCEPQTAGGQAVSLLVCARPAPAFEQLSVLRIKLL
jgi:hypothetical protein